MFATFTASFAGATAGHALMLSGPPSLLAVDLTADLAPVGYVLAAAFAGMVAFVLTRLDLRGGNPSAAVGEEGERTRAVADIGRLAA